MLQNFFYNITPTVQCHLVNDDKIRMQMLARRGSKSIGDPITPTRVGVGIKKIRMMYVLRYHLRHSMGLHRPCADECLWCNFLPNIAVI